MQAAKFVRKAVGGGVRAVLGRAGMRIVRTEQDDYETYRRLYPEDSLTNRRFYNIGAGDFRHKYWTNVDNPSEWYQVSQGDQVGIKYDLLSLTPLPIESGTAEAFFTSHCIEHITVPAAANLFREAHRALKPGGYFRATTPNVELNVRAYREKDLDFYYHRAGFLKPEEYKAIAIKRPFAEWSVQQLFLYDIASSVSTEHADGAPVRLSDAEVDALLRDKPLEEALDHCLSLASPDVQKRYPGNHQNWWSAAKLTRMLREAGFEDVYVSAYGQSYSPVLRNLALFDCTHPKVSLYVEARR